jgi:hypothetical protein
MERITVEEQLQVHIQAIYSFLGELACGLLNLALRVY